MAEGESNALAPYVGPAASGGALGGGAPLPFQVFDLTAVRAMVQMLWVMASYPIGERIVILNVVEFLFNFPRVLTFNVIIPCAPGCIQFSC